MTRKLAAHVVRIASAGGLIAGLALVGAPTASAADTNPPVVNSYWGGGGDTCYNYDCHNTSGSSSNIDWGIDIIFSGGSGANIPAIRSVVNNAGFNGPGGTEYGYIANRNYWDGSTGEKKPSGCTYPDSYHMRQYAMNIYSSYDPNIGYYVFASTHNDHWENCGGWTEETEASKQTFSGVFANAGYSVQDDYWGLSNTEEGTDSNGKVWDNNGWASWVHM